MTHALVTWTPAESANPAAVRNAVLQAVIHGNRTDRPVRFIDRCALVPTESEDGALERLRVALARVARAHPGTRVHVESAEAAGKKASRFYRPSAYPGEVVATPTIRPDHSDGRVGELRLVADA